MADHVVRIPVFGKKNSLNVGIAFGIAVADWRQKLTELEVETTTKNENESEACKSISHDVTGPSQKRTSRAPQHFKPIGTFHSPALYPYEAPRQAVADLTGAEGYIELKRGEQFEQALCGLEGFERLWLIYHFHHNDHWLPKVMPPRGPRVKRGVFATRSPYRPNPIGISCVELVRIEGLKIYVRGFDILDGTPIYDIKPYLPYADSFPDVRIGWLEGINQTRNEVHLSEHAERQLAWLESNGVKHLRGFLRTQLEFDPLDSERKRVGPVPEHDQLRIAYRTWRADFHWNSETRIVTVDKILSGYSPSELTSSTDPYNDKDTHRQFTALFL
jgi:tRNA-Thr(GGU) m(6)t(6)A37 methyltransferase TsaA